MQSSRRADANVWMSKARERELSALAQSLVKSVPVDLLVRHAAARRYEPSAVDGVVVGPIAQRNARFAHGLCSSNEASARRKVFRA